MTGYHVLVSLDGHSFQMDTESMPINIALELDTYVNFSVFNCDGSREKTSHSPTCHEFCAYIHRAPNQVKLLRCSEYTNQETLHTEASNSGQYFVCQMQPRFGVCVFTNYTIF